MSDTVFAYATLADVPALAVLIERAYRGPEAAKGWTNESMLLSGPRSSPAEIEGLLREPDSRFVTASADGKMIGCALIKKDGAGAYFGMFAIDPDLQGGGLGKLFITRCEAAAKDLWGATYLWLTVINLRDKLIGWYERRGFVQTGEHKPFPFDTATGALRTDFDLTILRKAI
jgi:ribosomal protein S18 acetylase RimI-like enzyme